MAWQQGVYFSPNTLASPYGQTPKQVTKSSNEEILRREREQAIYNAKQEARKGINYVETPRGQY